MNEQDTVAANVAARGYRDGWTPEQFVARQLCKMTEELAEAAYAVSGIEAWEGELSYAGKVAREFFDEPRAWEYVKLPKPDALRAELTDMMVVLLAAADAMGFYIVQAAIDKSAADVARGVR